MEPAARGASGRYISSGIRFDYAFTSPLGASHEVVCVGGGPAGCIQLLMKRQLPEATSHFRAQRRTTLSLGVVFSKKPSDTRRPDPEPYTSPDIFVVWSAPMCITGRSAGPPDMVSRGVAQRLLNIADRCLALGVDFGSSRSRVRRPPGPRTWCVRDGVNSMVRGSLADRFAEPLRDAAVLVLDHAPSRRIHVHLSKDNVHGSSLCTPIPSKRLST